ncbi:MAG: hypothetical protein KC501_30715 [Myxococcales bacterium]|nr:hypothetical protein [Myxococcales bacterium]
MIDTDFDPLSLYDRPARLGEHGSRARREAFGEEVWVRPAPAHPLPAVATCLRPRPAASPDDEPEVIELGAWPEPAALRAGDRLVVQVPSAVDDRRRFVAWLRAVAAAPVPELSVAPCCASAGGMHRLWCIAAARVLLPGSVRVEARHDLIGIRLAQLAVGFGADTLGGPIEPDRSLPLAGVTRPNEGTAAGLSTLVRQVGLHPRASDPCAPASPETSP